MWAIVLGDRERRGTSLASCVYCGMVSLFYHWPRVGVFVGVSGALLKVDCRGKWSGKLLLLGNGEKTHQWSAPSKLPG